MLRMIYVSKSAVEEHVLIVSTQTSDYRAYGTHNLLTYLFLTKYDIIQGETIFPPV